MDKPMVDPKTFALRSRTPGFPGQGQLDWIVVLLNISKALKFQDNPQIADLVRNIALKGNQEIAKGFVQRLAPAHYAQLVNPDHFISYADNLSGEFALGTTFDGKGFGLTRRNINENVAIVGEPGSGKSNLLELIVQQCQRNGVYVQSFDRKGDFLPAVRYGVDSIHWQYAALNPLCPHDTGIDIYSYRNHFSKIFVELGGFLQRGSAVFLLGLDAVYRQFHVYENWGRWDWQTMQFPTMRDLLDIFKNPVFSSTIRGQGRESLLSIIDKLEALIVELGPMLAYQRGFDFIKMFKQRRAVSYMLSGLSAEQQNFVILTLFVQHYHYFNTYGPRNALNVVMAFDECKTIYGRQNSDKLVLKDAISTGRELGIGIVAADQVPSELMQAFLSCCGSLFCFRTSDGTDLQKLMYSTGATRDQILANYSLKPGEAIVRTSKCADLLRIRVPLVSPEDKFISRQEVDAIMAPRLAELFADVIPARTAVAPTVGSNPAATPSQPPRLVLDADERRLLESVARDPDRPSSEIYEELGNPSKGFRTKQRLVAKGYITEVPASLGKNGKRCVYLVADSVVFADLGIPLGPGRGKALHKHFQAEFKAQAERLGFIARIEDGGGPTPAAPDLAVRKPGMQIAVEIAITSKPTTEADNIQKNLSLGFDRIILTFITKQALEKTRQLAAERYPAEVINRVTFCLVNNFTQVIERF
jgi:hypothetical protein